MKGNFSRTELLLAAGALIEWSNDPGKWRARYRAALVTGDTADLEALVEELVDAARHVGDAARMKYVHPRNDRWARGGQLREPEFNSQVRHTG